MITANKLFYRRLIANWKYQYSVWKTAVDWTVALYIVIPAMYFAIREYISWWHVPPIWISYVPFSFFLTWLFLFIWSGTIRIFVAEADQLFMLQHKSWIDQITKLSVAYSFIWNIFLTVLLFAFLMPFLLGSYKLSVLVIILLFSFTFLLKNVMGIIKQLTKLRFKAWRQKLAMTLLFILTGLLFRVSVDFLVTHLVFLIICWLFLLTLLILLVYRRIHKRGSFFEDVVNEQEEKLKYAIMLLRASGVNIKKPKTLKKGPLLFRHSNLLFKKRNPVNALVEVCIKSVCRNSRHLKFYIMMVLAGILLLTTFPVIWKWIIWLGYAAILTGFVVLYWRETINAPFIKMFKWHKEDQIRAAGKSLFIMVLPGYLLISVVLGWQMFSWTGFFLMIPVSVGISSITTKIASQLAF